MARGFVATWVVRAARVIGLVVAGTREQSKNYLTIFLIQEYAGQDEGTGRPGAGGAWQKALRFSALRSYVPGFTAARDNSDRQTGRAEKRSAFRHPPDPIRPPQAARIGGIVPLGVRGSRPRMTMNGAPPADNTRRQCSPHNVESHPAKQRAGRCSAGTA